MLVPFVDPSAVEAALLDRARRAEPEKTARLEALRELREAYVTLVAGARTAILQDVPSARPDPVAELASAKRSA